MPYSGAFVAACSSRFRRSTSLSSGAGEVRVATGSPNSAKNLSRPAGATVHSSLAGASAVLREAWGGVAGMVAESPVLSTRFCPDTRLGRGGHYVGSHGGSDGRQRRRRSQRALRRAG